MKRSEVNKLMKEAVEFIEKMHFKLPPFAFWSFNDWETKGSEYDEIRDNLLGWDITDFGSGNFRNEGLLLFTIRNGNLKNNKYKKSYAEKILIVEEEQVTPFHFHWNKMEDIINRGGGNLLVKVYNSTKDGGFASTPVQVSMDGKALTVEPGTILRLTPGESITLPVGMYHKFWGEKGTGKVLLGEVSMVNDDFSDNRFLGIYERFSELEEDETPLYLLANEY
ncbi:D-lyxose/D-mannose family sugar isomerase [Neobacillus sp. NPDC058068]|uniref:D-lyxose/D-mannose family sugar isomerase n=1 Tax=Neobacillus sp. NPDC058068 TaxID=3346325 RepID=UPI0036DBAFC6